MGDIGVRYPEPGATVVTINGQQYLATKESLEDLKSQKVAYEVGEQQESTPGGYKADFGQSQGTLADTERGVAHGATLGFADKKFGDSNQSMMQRMGGDDYADVKERTPVGTGVGDLFGSALLPVPGGGASAVGRIATQAAMGAGMGATRAYAEGEDPTKAGLVGGALGGVGTAGAEGLGALAQKAAPYISRGLNSMADSARTRGVFGMGTGSDSALRKITEFFGVDDLPAKFAALIESKVPQQGYSKGLNRKEYTDILQDQERTYGSMVGNMRERAGNAEGVNSIIPQEWAQMRQNVQDKINDLSGKVQTEEDAQLVAALTKNLERFDALKPPKTVNDMAAVKSKYQGAGHKGPMGTIPDNAAAEASAEMGSEGKDTLARLMDYAYDPTKNAHEAASKKYAETELLLEQLIPKSVREQFNTNAAGVAAAGAQTLGGGIMGGLSGLATGNPIGGALNGAAISAGMATGSGTRNFLTQVMSQSRGMDTIANLSRAAGKDLSNLNLDELRKLVASYIGKSSGYAGAAASDE